MNLSLKGNLLKALAIMSLGVGAGAVGIYVGDADDAPGAALVGLALMAVALAYGLRMATRKP